MAKNSFHYEFLILKIVDFKLIIKCCGNSEYARSHHFYKKKSGGGHVPELH